MFDKLVTHFRTNITFKKFYTSAFFRFIWESEIWRSFPARYRKAENKQTREYERSNMRVSFFSIGTVTEVIHVRIIFINFSQFIARICAILY